MLRDLPATRDSRVLSGQRLADDAGIFRVSDDLALIQTVDFFTPIVDDPRDYGQIAAANAMSDIYAMGGSPLTALNVAIFPIKSVPSGVLTDILMGAASKADEAGVSIIGGHTVEGDEPIFGMAVTGTIDPNLAVMPSGGQPGDGLILTKPIGTGIIATAAKAECANQDHITESVRWMLLLNKVASEVMVAAGAHASTDVTGFGLLGHLSEMAAASGVAAELSSTEVPLLPGAYGYAQRGFIPLGGQTNAEYIRDLVRFDGDTSDEIRELLSDPQTSGGILMAVPPDQIDFVLGELKARGQQGWHVGRLLEGQPGHITLR